MGCNKMKKTALEKNIEYSEKYVQQINNPQVRMPKFGFTIRIPGYYIVEGIWEK